MNFWGFLSILALPLVSVLSSCNGSIPGVQIQDESFKSVEALGQTSISAVWANSGEDKVTQEELRASQAPRSVVNSRWDGSTVKIAGARNEVVAFNLILEAANKEASRVSVEFNELRGPDGALIRSKPLNRESAFSWVEKPIELFYVRYLQIKGLSLMSYDTYDERHIPERMRRPFWGAGYGEGAWTDRPGHDKFFPDIAVPMELHPEFKIAQGTNQSVWVDIYIPKSIPAGQYSGTVKVREADQPVYEVPVALEVHPFTLPDEPSSKTMVFLADVDVNYRYLGKRDPESDAEKKRFVSIKNKHFMIAQRHRISLIDHGNSGFEWGLDRPSLDWMPRLDGSLYTPANGYDGPGVGTGANVYSIGSYGTWRWNANEQEMHRHTDAWELWFRENFPDVERFVYLVDESTDYAATQRLAHMMESNAGPGRSLKSMATVSLPNAIAEIPDLDVISSLFTVGTAQEWLPAVQAVEQSQGAKLFHLYNGKRPATGSFATEDDGVSLRTIPWIQYKHGVDRWFFWNATYYNDFQSSRGQINVFKTAQTFGHDTKFHDDLGRTGRNYSNGDGVLFYPGTDQIFPEESYDVDAPFASLRMKFWRRGIQDVEYLRMASKVAPDRVQEIVREMMPKSLWEYGVSDPDDPSWVRAATSWSSNPDAWERARRELARLIR